MCLFTAEVQLVSNTNIFARRADGRQLLVYGMTYSAATELAMVLPVPVLPGSSDDAVRFINLEECPDFFIHLQEGFGFGYGLVPESASLGMDSSVETLVVHEVGSFEASFVPRVDDFSRVDERFRLPPEVSAQMSGYQDYGFAVFKLKDTQAALDVHPMALSFPPRHPERLYFPTLHSHDGKIHAYADFDHSLFCQPAPEMNWHLQGWEDSEAPASAFFRCALPEPLVDLTFPCWRLVLRGSRENKDVWVGEGGVIPRAGGAKRG